MLFWIRIKVVLANPEKQPWENKEPKATEMHPKENKNKTTYGVKLGDTNPNGGKHASDRGPLSGPGWGGGRREQGGPSRGSPDGRRSGRKTHGGETCFRPWPVMPPRGEGGGGSTVDPPGGPPTGGGQAGRPEGPPPSAAAPGPVSVPEVRNQPRGATNPTLPHTKNGLLRKPANTKRTKEEKGKKATTMHPRARCKTKVAATGTACCNGFDCKRRQRRWREDVAVRANVAHGCRFAHDVCA